jgi:hypothetical protein
MPPINLLHDPLCPADSIRYGSYGSWHPRSAVVLCQFSSRQNRGGDQQHTLATFVHSGSLALSPYIRHGVAGRADARARGGEAAMPEPKPKRFVRGDEGRKQGSEPFSRAEPCPSGRVLVDRSVRIAKGGEWSRIWGTRNSTMVELWLSNRKKPR